MAHITRLAKSSSDWTKHELDAYNVNLASEDFTTFFEVPLLPPAGVSNEILTVDVQSLGLQDVSKITIDFSSSLDSVMVPIPSDNLEDSAVNDFAVALVRVTGYVDGYRFARTRKALPLLICGNYCHWHIDVSRRSSAGWNTPPYSRGQASRIYRGRLTCTAYWKSNRDV
jgi:hypothetical protein